MKIFVGADHRGFPLKQEVVKLLEDLGHEVVDKGSCQKGVKCDYPKFSYKVAKEVARAKNARGILVCLTGIGHSIAANKVPGAYAALCYKREAAILSRKHNNANILVLGAKFVTKKELKDIIVIWLRTKFEGGRHLRRVNQIKRIEKGTLLEG